MKPSRMIYRRRIEALRQRIGAAQREIAEIQEKCDHTDYEPFPVVGGEWKRCVACGETAPVERDKE
jgi:hypothetical protein